MGTTDTSVIPTEFVSVENTWDGYWNKNENDTNQFIFTPWPFRLNGCCRCLHLSVRLSITLDMLLENYGNFGEVINGTDIRPDSTHLSWYDILVQAPSRAGFCTGKWIELSKLTRPDLHHVVGLFILRDVRQSLESMRTEGSMNISPWFSRFISDSVTLDMLLENDGNFGEVINATGAH